MSRDCAERGRTVDEVIAQYHETVRPMHQAWVEPSKQKADLIVHSVGHSMEVAIEMMTNHLRVTADIPATDAVQEETSEAAEAS